MLIEIQTAETKSVFKRKQTIKIWKIPSLTMLKQKFKKKNTFRRIEKNKDEAERPVMARKKPGAVLQDSGVQYSDLSLYLCLLPQVQGAGPSSAEQVSGCLSRVSCDLIPAFQHTASAPQQRLCDPEISSGHHAEECKWSTLAASAQCKLCSLQGCKSCGGAAPSVQRLKEIRDRCGVQTETLRRALVEVGCWVMLDTR